MSFRNWLHNAAVRGCVAAILCATLSLSVFAQPLGDDTGGQSRADKAQDQPKTDNTPLILEAIKNQIERVARSLETNIDKPKSAKEEDRAKRDLDAQEGMAHWAKWLFWAACASIVLTIVALWLLYRTLGYTRTAATHTESAASAAREAARAAAEANIISRNLFVAEQRPWIQVTVEFDRSLKFDPKEASMRIKVTVENTGKSPAEEFANTGFCNQMQIGRAVNWIKSLPNN